MIDGVVLEIEFRHAQRPGQAVGPDQRRAADVQADRRRTVDGQQFVVSPHGPGPSGHGRSAERTTHGRVVVSDFQRTEVLGAEIQGFLGIASAAQPTLQAGHQFFRHAMTPDLAGGPFLPEGKENSAAGDSLTFSTVSPSVPPGRARLSRRDTPLRLDPGWRSCETGERLNVRLTAQVGLPTGRRSSHLSHGVIDWRSIRIDQASNPHWAGISTSIRLGGEPVAVASQGLSLSHSG